MDIYLLHHLLKKSALKYPHKIAIIEGKEMITYKELDEKSTILANMLIKIGLEPKEVVVVYLNKSIEAIIAFLAIVKAGCAYIPVDDNYFPADRIKTIIELSKTGFVITNTDHWRQFSKSVIDENSFNDLKILLTGTTREKKRPKLKGNCYYVESSMPVDHVEKHICTTSYDLAYILYTSGSTGIPKGVMISHLNALTFINWSLNYFSPSSTDIFASHAAFHFDLSVFDIYVSIASGGTLHLIPFHLGQNPRLLFDWIAGSGITYWYSVPSVWITILNFANPDFTRLVHLKNILFAGEEFPLPYFKKLMSSFPHASYYNLYGPTETNVCTAYHVTDLEKIADKPIPIGEACANTEIVVLNEENKPVSIKEEGELFVRGPSVTEGYYGNKEKTEEAFIVSPLPCHRGAKLYKTGDIVVRCDEKNYRFIGRKDYMVKISGFRIELQEIEAVLLKNNKIEEAIIKPIYNENRGSKVLHTFITTKNQHKCSVIELKEYCREKLPYYMIPEAFIFLEKMPRNANGKVDAKKLLEHVQ
ncbi:MAG: amino acid adenylation domain-containing protein [bacterium]